MRHKYETRALVLSRAGAGEANTLLTLLTPELGLVRVRAQGLRRSGAKLAASLPTLAESDVVLVRGKEHWRLAGAVLAENWFQRLGMPVARERAGRAASLVLRLAGGEERDAALYETFAAFLALLPSLPEELQDAAEIAVALRVLHALGFDDGEAPDLSPEALGAIAKARGASVARANRGIAASGL